jgi:hypothetical protein
VQIKLKHIHDQIISEDDLKERMNTLAFLYGQNNELAYAVKQVLLKELQECQILENTTDQIKGNYTFYFYFEKYSKMPDC